MRLPITPATTLWRELRDEVTHLYGGGRVIVAVDGIDGAGKTTFADGLAEVFAEAGSAVYRASIDGFHRPRAERCGARRRRHLPAPPRAARALGLVGVARRPRGGGMHAHGAARRQRSRS